MLRSRLPRTTFLPSPPTWATSKSRCSVDAGKQATSAQCEPLPLVQAPARLPVCPPWPPARHQPSSEHVRTPRRMTRPAVRASPCRVFRRRRSRPSRVPAFRGTRSRSCAAQCSKRETPSSLPRRSESARSSPDTPHAVRSLRSPDPTPDAGGCAPASWLSTARHTARPVRTRGPCPPWEPHARSTNHSPCRGQP